MSIIEVLGLRKDISPAIYLFEGDYIAVAMVDDIVTPAENTDESIMILRVDRVSTARQHTVTITLSDDYSMTCRNSAPIITVESAQLWENRQAEHQRYMAAIAADEAREEAALEKHISAREY